MGPNDFRRIALGMAGASERSHMDHPDFRANGRIFATLTHDEARGMVVLTPELQERFMRESAAFQPAAGAWGRQGCTMIDLRAADKETVGEAMTLAWQRSADKAAGRRAKATARRPKSKPAAKSSAKKNPRTRRRKRAG